MNNRWRRQHRSASDLKVAVVINDVMYASEIVCEWRYSPHLAASGLPH